MKYRLIVSDYDGTLLPGSRRNVSERTKDAIRAYCAAGGIFALSTGRAFESAKRCVEEMDLGVKIHIMCCQGALTADAATGEVISEIPMEKEAAAEFLRRAEKRGLQCQLYTDKNVYVPCLNKINEFYFERNKIAPVITSDLIERAQNTDEPILKVLCFINPEIREEMQPLFSGIEGAKTFTSNPRLFEAVSVRAGKDNGMRAVCRRLGVDISECAAFGDELNDADMIRAAGLGVAMGNAIDAVKNAADTVADVCENDGVAKVLEKITSGEI